MRGCLFTLLLGVVVVVVVVVVGLPAVAAGVLTAGLSASGLQAADTTVTVSSDPPTDLLGLQADTVHVTATDARYRDMHIGRLDLALGNVRILDRTFGSVDGELDDVTVTAAGGQEVTLPRITVLGGPDGITTTTVVPNAEIEALIADAVEHQTGVRPSSVTLTAPDAVTVKAGVTLSGRFAVTPSGDLVVRGDAGALGDMQVTLIKGGQDLPIHLTSVRVTSDGGLRLTGDLTIGLLGLAGDPGIASR